MTATNIELVRKIHALLPANSRKAMPACVIVERLNIKMPFVTGALRGLCLSNMVEKKIKQSKVLSQRTRHGVTKYTAIKQQHYWRIGDLV